MSIPVSGTLIADGAFAAIDPQQGIDGWRSVATHAARNAIITLQRRVGMAVVCQSDALGTVWQLNTATNTGTDADWTQLPAGSGTVVSGTSGQIAVYAGTGTSVSGESLSTLAAALNLSGTNTGDQSLAGLVATTTTVNGHALSSNVTVSASDLTTGTLPAAQLPNPSASTLGGVESIAAVAHNFLTSISTSGVPAAAQPAFTDISGTATAAQLPTTGLTITEHSAAIIVPTGTSGTITMNLALGDWQVPAQLTGNATLALSNPTVGQTFRVILQQSTAGTAVLTWFSGITWIGAPYTAPTLPATASAYLEAIIECIGSGVYLGHWLGNSAA